MRGFWHVLRSESLHLVSGVAKCMHTTWQADAQTVVESVCNSITNGSNPWPACSPPFREREPSELCTASHSDAALACDIESAATASLPCLVV